MKSKTLFIVFEDNKLSVYHFLSLNPMLFSDPGNPGLGTNLNLDYSQQPQPQGVPGVLNGAGAALNGGAALLNGGVAVANGAANGAAGPTLGGQASDSDHIKHICAVSQGWWAHLYSKLN